MKPRRGTAIVMVLVVLLLIEGMAVGMLALATHTRAAASAQLRNARAEAAAYLSARSVIRNWDVTGLDTLPLGVPTALVVGAGSEADASWSATIERLQSRFVIRTQAHVGGTALFSRASVMAVARTLDREVVLAELAAALTSGGPAIIAGSSTLADRDTACASAPPFPPAALVATAAPAISPTVSTIGAVVVDSTLAWSDSVALANASWADVAAIADRTETGVVVPIPAINGASCDTTAFANWGEPASNATPCAAYHPLVYSPGDLTMAGGRGQGILVVAGIFTMTGGAIFSGGVVARDGVSIGPNAQLRGAVLSRRGYALVQDADLNLAFCAVQGALAATRASSLPLPERRRFLPVF